MDVLTNRSLAAAALSTLALFAAQPGPPQSCITWCEETDAPYLFIPGDVTAVDGVTSIAPTGGTAGRWLLGSDRISIAPTAAAQGARLNTILGACAGKCEVALRPDTAGNGLFQVATLVTVPAGATFSGLGPATIIKATVVGTNALLIGGDSVSIRAITFHGVAVDGTTTQYAIFSAGGTQASKVSVTECVFTGADNGHAFNNAIKIDANCLAWNVSANRFLQMAGNDGNTGAGYGVICGATSKSIITKNWFYGSAFGGRHAVYLSAGASENIVSFNEIDGMRSSSINVYATTLQPACAKNLITKNIIKNEVTGQSGSGGIGVQGNVTENVVEGNTITDCTSPAIQINAFTYNPCLAVGNTVRGNKIARCGTDAGGDQCGILITGTLRTTVSGNEIEDCGFAGIHALSDTVVCNYVSIRDNVLSQSNLAAPTWREAIRLQPVAGGPTNASVTNNTMDAGTGADTNPGLVYQVAPVEEHGNVMRTEASQGTTALNGAVNVAVTQITDNQWPILTLLALGGTGTGLMPAVTKVTGLRFTLTPAVGDTSTWAWRLP